MIENNMVLDIVLHCISFFVISHCIMLYKYDVN